MATNFSINLAYSYMESARINREFENNLAILDILLERYNNELYTEGKVMNAINSAGNQIKSHANNVVNTVKNSKTFKNVENSKPYQIMIATKNLFMSVVDLACKVLNGTLTLITRQIEKYKNKQCRSKKDLTKKQQMIFKVMRSSSEIFTRYIGALKYNSSIGNLLNELKDDENGAMFKANNILKVAPATLGVLPGPNVVLYAMIPINSMIDVARSYVSFFKGEEKLGPKFEEAYRILNEKTDLKQELKDATGKICNNMKRICQIARGEITFVNTSLNDCISGKSPNNNDNNQNSGTSQNNVNNSQPVANNN